MRISDLSSDVCSSDLPHTQAAQKIAPGFAAIREQAQAAKETRRLESLWTYQTSAIGGGTQRTATIYSEDDARPHVQLVLRQHRKIGRASCRERVCRYV